MLRNLGGGEFEVVWPKDSGLVVPGDARSLSLTDLDRDGRNDLVVAINNGEVLGFLCRGGAVHDASGKARRRSQQ